jgi:hypothetical protein
LVVSFDQAQTIHIIVGNEEQRAFIHSPVVDVVIVVLGEYISSIGQLSPLNAQPSRRFGTCGRVI